MYNDSYIKNLEDIEEIIVYPIGDRAKEYFSHISETKPLRLKPSQLKYDMHQGLLGAPSQPYNLRFVFNHKDYELYEVDALITAIHRMIVNKRSYYFTEKDEPDRECKVDIDLFTSKTIINNRIEPVELDFFFNDYRIYPYDQVQFNIEPYIPIYPINPYVRMSIKDILQRYAC